MRFTDARIWSEHAARACAIALGFSIPISVAIDNVLLVLILIFWVATLSRDKLMQFSSNRIAFASHALFVLFIIGLSYGTREPGDGLRYLGKYADLFFIPIFIALFNTEQVRRYAWYMFAASMMLTLLLSFLLWANVVSHGNVIGADPLQSAVFKRYLTQNVMMAFTASLFIYLARLASRPAARYAWSALAILAMVNVFLLNPGRTGQLILAVLMVYSICLFWRWRGALLTAMAAIVLLTMISVDTRFSQAFTEMKAWQPGAVSDTSTGQRLEYYRNSLQIALAHPLVGNGTGSFPKVYVDHVAGGPMASTENPHNEFLNIAVQIGTIGLLALIYLFFCEWRLAGALAAMEETFLARSLVITFVIGCLFNSLLMDHVEGLFFAWASGILFAGLKAPAGTGMRAS